MLQTCLIGSIKAAIVGAPDSQGLVLLWFHLWALCETALKVDEFFFEMKTAKLKKPTDQTESTFQHLR